ncbi:MAG: hypothetical protein RSD49_06800 [Hafnia sp.]
MSINGIELSEFALYASILGVCFVICSLLCLWHSNSMKSLWIGSGYPSKSEAPAINEWKLWQHISLLFLVLALGFEAAVAWEAVDVYRFSTMTFNTTATN